MNPQLKKILKRANKYNAKSQRCRLGHYHPSYGEAMYCLYLSGLKEHGDIKDFEYQKRYELRVNGKLIGHHKPDFTVTTKLDKQEVHEFKGFETTDWQLRHKIFEAIYPEIPYIVIK